MPKLPNNLFPEYDNPDEITLLPQEGVMNYDDAMKFAETSGLRLPTKEELHYLLAVGKLEQGDRDCWSSSVNSSYRGGAWIFYGINGYVNFNSRNGTNSVRCVARPAQVQNTPTASEASLSDVCILLTAILEKMK
jgi:hypothetical protein